MKDVYKELNEINLEEEYLLKMTYTQNSICLIGSLHVDHGIVELEAKKIDLTTITMPDYTQLK